MVKRLVVYDDVGEVIAQADGTFLAMYPTSSGVHVIAEGDFAPAKRKFEALLSGLVSFILERAKATKTS